MSAGPTFIVLGHKQPAQVRRLAERLAPSRVLVHVDAGLPEPRRAEFERTLASAGNVELLPAHRSGWASWGLVAAALEGLRAAVADERCTHAMLLSGQDYPLRPGPALREFFLAHRDTTFMARWPLPSRLWGRRGGMDRLRPWQVPFRGRRLRLPVWRRLPAGVEPYGGSMYWALTAAAARDVLALMRDRPELPRFYRHTWIPDEMFVPTLVMNSPSRAGVANEGLTYIRWPDAGGRHPAVLGADELPALAAAAAGPSEVGGRARCKLFARKFDVAVDARVLDAIDRELLSR
jgi:Core-2/I-Branching enzyme